VDHAIEMEGVRKQFSSGLFRKRRTLALRGIDIQVPAGAFWGLLGPNGAGKTTLLSILSNLILPDSGTVRVLGRDVLSQGPEVYPRMNLSSGHANFLWSMNVRENLSYYAMLYGLSRPRRRERIDSLMDLFDLTPYARVKFDELSTGTKQKLALAKALINEPELLLLDEPTVGLDPDVSNRIREAIRRLHRDRGVTVLMTTHNMKEAQALCEQVAFIREGTIRAHGRPEDLKRSLGLGDAIEIVFRGILDREGLSRQPGVYSVRHGDASCRILVDDHHSRLPRIFDFLSSGRIEIQTVDIKEADLEEVFFAMAK